MTSSHAFLGQKCRIVVVLYILQHFKITTLAFPATLVKTERAEPKSVPAKSKSSRAAQPVRSTASSSKDWPAVTKPAPPKPAPPKSAPQIGLRPPIGLRPALWKRQNPKPETKASVRNKSASQSTPKRFSVPSQDQGSVGAAVFPEAEDEDAEDGPSEELDRMHASLESNDDELHDEGEDAEEMDRMHASLPAGCYEYEVEEEEEEQKTGDGDVAAPPRKKARRVDMTGLSGLAFHVPSATGLGAENSL